MNDININKYIRFLFTGLLNVIIYMILIISFEILTNNRFISLVIGQAIISIFAFFSFSKLSFNVIGNLKMYIRFIISNIFLLLISSFIAFSVKILGIGLDHYQFAILNVIIITPISFLLNNNFVFIGKKND